MTSAVRVRPTSVLQRANLATVVLLRGDREVASWPLARDDRPALACIDDLAHLQLAARRLGYSIVVREAHSDLVELLGLVGLCGVLSGVEVGGQAEHLEQVGVEEEVQLGDPIA